MRCEMATKDLDSFRTGELSGRDRESITRHLAGCGSCSRQLAEIQRLALGMARLAAPAPPSILERLLQDTGEQYAAVETALGRLWVGFSPRGITMIDPSAGAADLFETAYSQRYGLRPRAGELPRSYSDAVRKAAAGGSCARVSIDLSRLSSFEGQVLSLLRHIPRGEVRPYGWLAREAGSPGAVRAVGNTMARNPIPFLLPCHRVIPAAGGIGRYAFGTPMKRTLLEREGVAVDQIEQYARAGVRYLGCGTTGIFCFPTCRDARRVKAGNRVLFASLTEAAHAGFRPCRHCRPQ